jgi:hypothetical protein
MFCASGLIFGGTKGVRSRFHIFRSRTCFRRCRGHQILFSCFALLDTFSAVPRASGPIFMFCTPRLVSGGTEGVGFRFHILRSRTHFLRYGGRRVSISCFARPDSFSAEMRVSGPVFMFYAPRVISRGTEGIGSRFQALCTGIVFDDIAGTGSRFHVLRVRTHFRQSRGRRVPFS